MGIALAIVAIIVGSVAFHALSPWWLTPLASNWKQMDDTFQITIVITGIFFVVLSLFLVYCLLRFRHRPGQRAAYEPENRKTERWLIAVTTVGIAALLAPGLFVYAEYVRPPHDAMVVEALGQQWQWRFRLPGADGKLGATDVRFISGTNPFGLDPGDAAAKNNVLVSGSELHLPVGKPVKMLLRASDVLHDFYVPQMRARMNIVPGMVTTFWFTPTQTGRFEILCAQLCGIGHFNMRSHVVVEDEAGFQAWLKTQPTFGQTPPLAATAAGAAPATAPKAGSTAESGAAVGKQLAQSKACTACHSADGTPGVGPSWKGLAGSTRSLADGSSVKADDAYLKHSITDPQAQLVKGFGPVMPKVPLTDEEVSALVDYIKSLAAPPAGKG